MATSPAPVLTVTGIARAIVPVERLDNAETGESRQAARVQVLTDLGGFIEVYIAPENVGVLPVLPEGAPFEPFVIAWDCEVRAWNRTAFGQTDVPVSERRKYADLSCRFRSVAPARAAARSAA